MNDETVDERAMRSRGMLPILSADVPFLLRVQEAKECMYFVLEAYEKPAAGGFQYIYWTDGWVFMLLSVIKMLWAGQTDRTHDLWLRFFVYVGQHPEIQDELEGLLAYSNLEGPTFIIAADGDLKQDYGEATQRIARELGEKFWAEFQRTEKR